MKYDEEWANKSKSHRDCAPVDLTKDVNQARPSTFEVKNCQLLDLYAEAIGLYRHERDLC